MLRTLQTLLAAVFTASLFTACGPEARLATGDTHTRYSAAAPVAPAPGQSWEASAWKGERIHTQLLLRVSKPVTALPVTVTDLQGAGGSKIPASAVTVGVVREVWTDVFGPGCGFRKPGQYDSSLVADQIDTELRVTDTGRTHSLWVSLQVPAATGGGEYRGKIRVLDQEIPVRVMVQEQVLPPAGEWSFDLDLWQHPAAIARVHGLNLWSEEHFEQMRPYYQMLAAAGQKNITTSIVEEPWGHQTYDDFPSLIKWIRGRDGSWSFDYSLFDRYVQFVMECGISKRINCYSMIPWKTVVRYRDEALGVDTSITTPIGSPAYLATWVPMLTDFTRHLKEKGWFGITSMAMDERPLKDMQTAIALLKGIDPAWKIALAGDYHPEIEADIYDYCLASRWQFQPEALARRKAAGMPSTVYTCCVEAYPNGFTFSAPDEHVWLGWYAAARGFTGYLRWAYNSWPASPLTDSRFTAWPAGDTYQVYPGPRSSIRFEKLVEGIQDYEKIRILRAKWQQEGRQDKLQSLEGLLSAFEIAALAQRPAAEMVQEARRKLEQLQ